MCGLRLIFHCWKFLKSGSFFFFCFFSFFFFFLKMNIKFSLNISLYIFRPCFYIQTLICVIWESKLCVNSGALYLLYQCEPPQPQNQQFISSEQNKVQNYSKRWNPINSKLLASVLLSTKRIKMPFLLTFYKVKLLQFCLCFLVSMETVSLILGNTLHSYHSVKLYINLCSTTGVCCTVIKETQNAVGQNVHIRYGECKWNFPKGKNHKTRKSKLYDYSCICVWLHVLSLDLSGIILKEESTKKWTSFNSDM